MIRIRRIVWILCVFILACKNQYEKKQEPLKIILKQDNLSAFVFSYNGDEMLYTLDDILSQDYLIKDNYSANPIDISKIRIFFNNEDNFYYSDADCTTFLINKGIVFESKTGIEQVVFNACSGDKLICIENGKFVSFYLTGVGKTNFAHLLQ